MRQARRFKDKDFIQTSEGFLFCVVGYQHPPKKVIAYLKYVPSPTGKWSSSEARYTRSMKTYTIPNLQENINWLKQEWSRYVFQSEVLGIEISAVPTEDFKRYYCPEKKLSQLLDRGRADILEDSALRLIKLLAERSDVSIDAFGITGSILIGIHNPGFSDVDVVIYGRENSLKIKETLTGIYREQDKSVSRLSGTMLDHWCFDKEKSYTVSSEEAKRFYDRKWNYGLFEDRPFSVHPVKEDHEILENYGDEIYHAVGLAEIEATVTRVCEPVFLPYIYNIDDVLIKEGVSINKITQIVTQEGFYGGAEVDERIAARGKLERVTKTGTNEIYYRLFIGSLEADGKDYLKPLSFSKV